MAFYAGDGIKRKIIINGVKYRLNLLASAPAVKTIKLLTKDGKQLKDAGGFALMIKEK